jgi:hypothetical protein
MAEMPMRALSLAAALALPFVSACSSGSDGAGPAAARPQPAAGQQVEASSAPDATVEMREFQLAFIGSGGGNGMLHYKGQDYPITIAGLGLGRVGRERLARARCG